MPAFHCLTIILLPVNIANWFHSLLRLRDYRQWNHKLLVCFGFIFCPLELNSHWLISVLLSGFSLSEASQIDSRCRLIWPGVALGSYRPAELTVAQPTCGSEWSTVPGCRPGCSWLCSAHSPQIPETSPFPHWATEITQENKHKTTIKYKHMQTYMYR